MLLTAAAATIAMMLMMVTDVCCLLLAVQVSLGTKTLGQRLSEKRYYDNPLVAKEAHKVKSATTLAESACLCRCRHCCCC